MIGIAQISPIESGATRWYARDEVDERLEIEAAGGVGDELARDADRRADSLANGPSASFGSSR